MKLPEFGKPLPASEKRIILGKPTQQLFPLKYPFMWEAFRTAHANHWTPEDTPLNDDIEHYGNPQKMSEADKRMFDWVLSMLTTQDLVVMGNLEEGIERHLTAPEASIYLGRQTDEEGIHTWSYQWIIESLSLNQQKVYERYLFEESLYNKVEYSFNFHRRLLELRLDDHQTNAAIGEFLVCMAFWTLGMEGGWFYNGFNWIYALRRRNLMPGTAKIFKYIQRDEALHFNFWIDVMNTIIAEHPKAYTRSVQASIITMVKDVVHLEEKYAFDACQGVLGITSKDYMQHFRHFMNSNLGKIGIQPIYEKRFAKPLAWLGEITDINTEQNFFEGVVTEYQKTGLVWEDNDDDHFGSVL